MASKCQNPKGPWSRFQIMSSCSSCSCSSVSVSPIPQTLTAPETYGTARESSGLASHWSSENPTMKMNDVWRIPWIFWPMTSDNDAMTELMSVKNVVAVVTDRKTVVFFDVSDIVTGWKMWVIWWWAERCSALRLFFSFSDSSSSEQEQGKKVHRVLLLK